jgi:hypothetical protein
LKFCRAGIKFEDDKDKKKEKKIVVDTKPETLLVHVLDHRVKDTKIFQTPPQNHTHHLNGTWVVPILPCTAWDNILKK